jgi:excinuclease ABC subunit A
VSDALRFFEPHQKIHRMVECLHDVGLDYIQLGQPATTMSGGEAQRIKLASELAMRNVQAGLPGSGGSGTTGAHTLYVLDEPTTGLHFADVQKLLAVLQRLADAGHTLIVIEHNLDVIKCADWIIDLGPEGGDGGGMVIATGTPETIAKHATSFTGAYLAPILSRATGASRSPDTIPSHARPALRALEGREKAGRRAG